MSATVYYEPYRLPAGILAFVVHGVFFALLYFGFSWNRQASLPATMKVELWSSLPEEVIAPPEIPKVEKIAQPPPSREKFVEPEIVIPDKRKVTIKPVVSTPVKKKTALKAIDVAKPQPNPEKERPVEKNPDVRVTDQQAERERAERIAQEEQTAATGRMVDEYKAKIMAKIRSNVRMPTDVVSSARAEFSVTLLPGGAVLQVNLKKSSGNAAYDNAVERAILKSDPLPLPPDVALFNRFRELNLVFKPTE